MKTWIHLEIVTRPLYSSTLHPSSRSSPHPVPLSVVFKTPLPWLSIFSRASNGNGSSSAGAIPPFSPTDRVRSPNQCNRYRYSAIHCRQDPSHTTYRKLRNGVEKSRRVLARTEASSCLVFVSLFLMDTRTRYFNRASVQNASLQFSLRVVRVEEINRPGMRLARS